MSDAPNQPRQPADSDATGPDWSRVPFEVPCTRCGANVHGRTGQPCPNCGLRLAWERVLPLEELRCQDCGYQLFGLTSQRCPECGRPFEWPVALAAARIRRIRLFEFLWFSNPVPGFFRSVWLAALRPRKLWAHYDHPIPPRVWPLTVFVLLQWLMLAYGWHAMAGIVDPVMNGISTWLDARVPVIDRSTGGVFRGGGRPLTFIYRFRVGPFFVASLLAWYVVSFLALQIFFETKRRLKIGWRDLLRVYVHATVFASLCTAGWCVLEALVDATLFIDPALTGRLDRVYVLLGRGVLAAGVLVTWAHLWIGLRCHLKFPHAGLVAAVSLLLGFLVANPF